MRTLWWGSRYSYRLGKCPAGARYLPRGMSRAKKTSTPSTGFRFMHLEPFSTECIYRMHLSQLISRSPARPFISRSKPLLPPLPITSFHLCASQVLRYDSSSIALRSPPQRSPWLFHHALFAHTITLAPPSRNQSYPRRFAYTLQGVDYVEGI